MTASQAVVEMLRDAETFARLSPAQLSQVASRARLVRLATDEILFSQGGHADCFFYLVSGQLKLYRLSPEGQEKIIEVIEPGTTFAETRVFLENPRYHLTCSALADSEVIGIDSRNFRAVLRESPDTCLLMLGELSQRLDGLINQIDQLTLQNATTRVAGYVLSRLPRGASQYLLRISKGVLASRVSVRAETLSRILRQLSHDGIVSVDSHGRVYVHDLEKLRKAAGAREQGEARGEKRFRPHRG
jgi:CRP-like cAMP-binding protein